MSSTISLNNQQGIKVVLNIVQPILLQLLHQQHLVKDNPFEI
jgi:hypothetical protein